MIDTTRSWAAFLAPRGVSTDAEGLTGHRLRTVKLRGQISQGLALPLAGFAGVLDGMEVGTDVSATLGVWKWEPPIPAALAGAVHGPLPALVPKTDEERVQNLAELLERRDLAWSATEKIDGTSMSVWVDPEADRQHGVCSRSLDLVEDTENTLWRLATELDLPGRAARTWPGRRVTIQGECYGEGIQKNPLGIRGQRFLAFRVQVDLRDVPRSEWPEWLPAVPHTMSCRCRRRCARRWSSWTGLTRSSRRVADPRVLSGWPPTSGECATRSRPFRNGYLLKHEA